MASTRTLWACLTICSAAVLALPAHAAQRVRAGQWQVSMEIAGRTLVRPMCLTQADADAINGDAASIKAYSEPHNAKAGCKVLDVKIDGQQVTVRSVCANGKENVGTTTYHGDRYETTHSGGVKSQGKWLGACAPQ